MLLACKYKKIGYKLHSLVKNPKSEFTSVKSTFTSVDWLVFKKSCLDILSCNEIC